jgi:hypothetical protein
VTAQSTVTNEIPLIPGDAASRGVIGRVPLQTGVQAVFDFYGLRSKDGWNSASAQPQDDGPADFAFGLRSTLERLGGIYAAFGQFLSWRADLLDAAGIGGLRQMKPVFPLISSSDVAAMIRREFGPGGAELAASLSETPLWNTFSRTAYLSKYHANPVVVQVAAGTVSDGAFAEFEDNMRSIRRVEAAPIIAPAILSQFRAWVRNGESLTREGAFLQVLGRHKGETLAAYPVPIPEISSASFLCWPAVEGVSAAELIERGNRSVTVLIASAVLEQLYSLAMVDASLDLDSVIIDRNNRLHFRRLNNPIAVAPSLINHGIKYAAAVVAGDAARSAQTLLRLVIPHPSLDLETELVDEFSGVEPELKINMWFPPSAAAFESNWRALAKLAPSRPLFLDCFHRNLIAAGYWNSDSVRAGAPSVDAITEAQWPAVGRLIRTQFDMLLNKETAAEWAIGSGLAVFGAMKEINRLAEEMRDNDLTVGVDITEPADRDRRPAGFFGVFALGGLMILLLASLLWGGTAPQPWPTLLKVLAASTLPAMFWAVSRIG